MYKLLDKITENNIKLIDIIRIINTDLQNIINKLIKLNIESDNNFNKLNAVLIFSINFKKENLIDYLDIFIKKIKKKDVRLI